MMQLRRAFQTVVRVRSSIVVNSKVPLKLKPHFFLLHRIVIHAVCCAVERLYVDESIQQEFEQKVVDIAKNWKVGNPNGPDGEPGPKGQC